MKVNKDISYVIYYKFHVIYEKISKRIFQTFAA